ncbi:hypothetical protein ACT3HK_14385 [Thermolongibacillus altinsuensis]
MNKMENVAEGTENLRIDLGYPVHSFSVLVFSLWQFIEDLGVDTKEHVFASDDNGRPFSHKELLKTLSRPKIKK